MLEFETRLKFKKRIFILRFLVSDSALKILEKISSSEDESDSDLDHQMMRLLFIPLEDHPNFDKHINFRESY